MWRKISLLSTCSWHGRGNSLLRERGKKRGGGGGGQTNERMDKLNERQKVRVKEKFWLIRRKKE